jgi:S-methylmethionine-dependent homocysteine/selenocysteine methylase
MHRPHHEHIWATAPIRQLSHPNIGPFITNGDPEPVGRRAAPGFMLLRDPLSRVQMRRYYARLVEAAASIGAGCVLETPTARANQDVAWRHDVSLWELDALNAASVALLHGVARKLATHLTPIIVSGRIGPRHAGTTDHAPMTPREAAAYHRRQAEVLARSGVDCVTATHMRDAGEAIGIAEAARLAGVPAIVSFRVDADGRLPNRQPLGAAIDAVETGAAAAPIHYMVDCARTDDFAKAMGAAGSAARRVRGLRVSARPDYGPITARYPHITVFGCLGAALPPERSIQ